VNTISKNLKIKFLGGTQEVGRSAVALKSGGTQVLLDYGVKLAREPGFPMHIPPREIDAVILSHAHLDHSGAIPIFHIRGHTPVFATPPTLDIAKLLISDFIKLSGYYLPFEFIDLQNMMNCSENKEYNKPFKIGSLKIQLLNAGHIPGSSQVVLESSKKKIVYTGDYNPIDTQLLRGADQSYKDVDALLIEGTYANEDHMPRSSVEEAFITKLREVVERGGTVLVPAFAVGRSQEILCVLAAHNFEYPVVIDGMAKDVNEILLKYPGFLRDPDLFKQSLNIAKSIKGWSDRRRTIKKPGVIVSPAGMLKGGNAIFYMNKIAKKSNNAICMVSFQIPGTPGHELLTSKRFIIRGKMSIVKAEVEHFDFTSHGGQTQLIQTVEKMSNDSKIFIMHGEEEKIKDFSEIIKDKFGFSTTIPKAGDIFRI
jgi:putative mRNA 3-end processing factor